MSKKSTSCNCSNDSSNSNARYTVLDNNQCDFVAEGIRFDQIAEHISEYMGDNGIGVNDAEFSVYRDVNVNVDIKIISNPKVTVTLK